MDDDSIAGGDEDAGQPGLPDSSIELVPEVEARPSRGGLRLVSDTQAPDIKRTKVRSAKLPNGLTEKQEHFVQGIGNGLSLSDAYRAAYVTHSMMPATVHVQSCLLMQDPKITARLIEVNLEKEDQRRMLSTSRAERVIQRLEKLADFAGTDAVRVRATELLGKTVGLFTDAIEVKDAGSGDPTAIEKRILERLRRLGLAG